MVGCGGGGLGMTGVAAGSRRAACGAMSVCPVGMLLGNSSVNHVSLCWTSCSHSALILASLLVIGDARLTMLASPASMVCARRVCELVVALPCRPASQGKNVQVAMGKMKESQATAQANIWIILAHSAVKPLEQLEAYNKAIEILSKAQQYSVIDVKLELADLTDILE